MSSHWRACVLKCWNVQQRTHAHTLHGALDCGDKSHTHAVHSRRLALPATSAS